LASPVLTLAELMIGEMPWHHWPANVPHQGLSAFVSGPIVPLWLASVTSFFLTYGFGLALVAGFDFYRRLRDAQLRTAALERSLNAAHLAALRMQLSPHTLFNLLHTIRGQIEWDPVAAQSLVVQLADLLRRLLKAGERELSRLCDELQFVRLYLDLQQKRFSDRLTVRVPAQDAIPTAWVPSLILQPLVENAVVHGLAGDAAAVVIRVEAFVDEETLCLRVVNSTVPRQPHPGQGGIGLKNVRERLAIQFGDRANFRASAGDDNDWIAEIRMPFLRDGP
jgi:two-component system LytT family sensor kinase